jgi:hypothetical protein
MKWEYYRPGHGDEDDARFMNIANYGAYDKAAEFITEVFYGDWDFPQETVLRLRPQHSTKWKEFKVEVETQPVFSASEQIDDRGDLEFREEFREDLREVGE